MSINLVPIRRALLSVSDKTGLIDVIGEFFGVKMSIIDDNLSFIISNCDLGKKGCSSSLGKKTQKKTYFSLS